jgi:hypothetical protein
MIPILGKVTGYSTGNDKWDKIRIRDTLVLNTVWRHGGRHGGREMKGHKGSGEQDVRLPTAHSLHIPRPH